jgi:uncharacterized protein involved in exopolysaccharide biosynthesis
MRIYGTSPLYNYVELVFRCKRLFIVAIIIGTVLTSALALNRQTLYSGFMLIEVAPNAPLINTNDKEVPLAQRRAIEMITWLRKEPNTVSNLLRNQGFDRKYPDKEFEEKVKMASQKISDPGVLNNRYLEVSIQWPNKEEAISILDELYARYKEKIVAQETSSKTASVDITRTLFNKYEKEADAKTATKTNYLINHFFQMPGMINPTVGRVEALNSAISETKMQLADAQTSLNDISGRMKGLPEWIEDAVTVTNVTTDPAGDAKKQLADLNDELKKLLGKYSELHPAVRAKQQEVDAKKAEIEELKKKPKEVATTGSTTTRRRNPQYDAFLAERNRQEVYVLQQQKRLASLQTELGKQEGNLKKIPADENTFNKIERDWKISNSMRDQLYSQLKSAEIGEENEKLTKNKEMNLKVDPKDTVGKMDSAGKTALLFVVGPFLGILIAFCFSLLAETMDHTLRTPVEVEKYLGKPVLAVLPAAKTAKGDRRKKLGGGASKPSITS